MKINIGRAGFFYFLFFVIGLIAIGRILQLQFISPPDAEAFTYKVTRDDVTDGIRGSILSDDGRYLAFSTPLYKIYMDCTVASDELFNKNIEALSKELSSLFKDKSTAQYKKIIVSGRRANKRYLKVVDRPVTYPEMIKVCSFPIYSAGKRNGGIITEKIDHREYPYETLAKRTLGYVRNNTERTTKGLEGRFDTILRGQSGIQPMRLTDNKSWIPDNEREYIPSQDGLDIQTTIDIDIQDVAERALLNNLKSSNDFKEGAVIVMEVATGKIKAMVNMGRNKNGEFDEIENYAITRTREPGSVFKLATLLVLLENGITLDTEIDAVTNLIYGGRVLDDHYLKNYDKISVQRGFEISSNNVFRLLAIKNFEKRPEIFTNTLKKLNIRSQFDFDIDGFRSGSMREPSNRMWSPVDLPSLAIGYSSELTPLQLITFYNAVANNGIMMKPYLVKNFQKNGNITKEFMPQILTTISSQKNISEAKKALRGVVLNGTGKVPFKDCRISVSGKTGTARIYNNTTHSYLDKNGNKSHVATFIGFFPSDAPKYTAIAILYSLPSKKDYYGGTWAAPVVREIAENIYAASPDWSAPILKKEKLPIINQYENNTINDTIQGTPNVIGMGLKDALNILENDGYKVYFKGQGKIITQEPAPGTPIDSTRNIKILLSDIYEHN